MDLNFPASHLQALTMASVTSPAAQDLLKAMEKLSVVFICSAKQKTPIWHMLAYRTAPLAIGYSPNWTKGEKFSE